MNNTKNSFETPERKLLREIGGLSDRVRDLRAARALDNSVQIKALEVQSRAKWDELRLLRAGPTDVDMSAPRARGHYQ